jgi:ribosomal protein S27E
MIRFITERCFDYGSTQTVFVIDGPTEDPVVCVTCGSEEIWVVTENS